MARTFRSLARTSPFLGAEGSVAGHDGSNRNLQGLGHAIEASFLCLELPRDGETASLMCAEVSRLCAKGFIYVCGDFPSRRGASGRAGEGLISRREGFIYV